MTSTELAQPQTFEQRLKQRIKDSMGDLLSDEELAKMVQVGVKSVFFDRREVKDGYRTTTIPCVIDEIVKDLLQSKVREAVVEWINSNPDAVKEAISTMLEKGAGLALMAAVGSIFSNDMNTLRMNLEERLRNGQYR